MIVSWKPVPGSNGLPDEILVELRGIIGRHPWWLARAELVIALMRKSGIRPGASVLDAGCGWGVTLEALEAAGYRAIGLDASRAALEQLDLPGRRLIHADLVDLPPWSNERFDAVLALDVIEHIDDDRTAVSNLVRLTKSGGVVIVSVPALPELFSEFDEIQKHHRRYLPERLLDVCRTPGLSVDRVLWWGRSLVASARRRCGRRFARPGDAPVDIYRRYLHVPRPMRLAMRLVLAVEKHLTLSGVSRLGTSLFIVARRS